VAALDRRSRIARQIGVPLGAKSDPVAPALHAFEAKGVTIRRNLLARLRTGYTSGLEVEERLLSAELLRANRANRKTHFYLEFAATGLRLRTLRGAKQAAHIYSSSGFTAAIGEALAFRSQAIRRCLRAMRVDLSCSLALHPDAEFETVFCRTADAYLEAYLRLPPSLHASVVLALESGWDRQSALSFYRTLHGARNARRSIGTWTAYEVEVLHAFYTRSAATGHAVTPLDRWVLRARIEATREGSIVDRVKDLTQIEVDENALETHRNVLLYGKPTRSEEVAD
jgi:hypothetical protein